MLIQRVPHIDPETRLIDLTFGELLAAIQAENSKLLQQLPKAEDDEYFNLPAFQHFFKVKSTTVGRMRAEGLPFEGKGQRSRILKSVALAWWKEHGSKYVKR